jgi:hypothetical protein
MNAIDVTAESTVEPTRAAVAARSGKDYALIALWSAVVVGQLAFLLYLLLFYGLSMLLGEPELWNQNQMLPKGFVAGDRLGNGMFGWHMLAAMLVVGTGLIQLIPAVRKRAPRLHRWSGRVFLSLGMLAALSGLTLKMLRTDTVWWHELGSAIAGNTLLILIFSALAWWYARKRQFVLHQRFALRAFVVIAGVFFLRAGFFGSISLVKALSLPITAGALFSVWAYLSYLLPLLILEFIWWQPGNRLGQHLRSAILWLVAVFLLIGCAALLVGIYLPLMGVGMNALVG